MVLVVIFVKRRLKEWKHFCKGMNTPSVKRQDPIGMLCDAPKRVFKRHNAFQWDRDA